MMTVTKSMELLLIVVAILSCVFGLTLYIQYHKKKKASQSIWLKLKDADKRRQLRKIVCIDNNIKDSYACLIVLHCLLLIY